MIYFAPFVYVIPLLLFYLLGILNGKQVSLVTVLLSLGYYHGIFVCKILGGKI